MGEFRKNFGRIEEILEVPNLIDIQTRSYETFLQEDVAPENRKNFGLQGAFKSVFPISDFSGKCSLEFVSYKIGAVRYDVNECIQKGMTYAAPLKIVVRLVVFDTDRLSDQKNIRDIKEQEIYFGEIPLMTEKGTFIVNGTERVIVSQLHRSPGIFFDHDKGKTLTSGKLIYSARIIPIRGSWLDLEFDSKDLLYVRIDRRRKMPVTILLKAMGYSTEDLLNYFYDVEHIFCEGENFYAAVDESLVGHKLYDDIRDINTGEILFKKGRRINKVILKRIREQRVERIKMDVEELPGRILATDILDPETGEVLFHCNEALSAAGIDVVREKGIRELSVINLGEDLSNVSIRDTLLIDRMETPGDAIIEIYRRLRPSNPPTPDTAQKFFNSLFFENESYDLSTVGRAKMNYKLRLDVSTDVTVLRKEDIMAAVKYLIDLKNGVPECSVDDIDHLGNRRVRSVGELIENQYRIGLVRMERAIKEKMSLQDIETMMPHDLVNVKPVSAVVSEFFGSSQLSQFMDQTNPLSEITHKRRLSALGPGGLTRERAGFEVRDVHPTHYGRICPVETPEGPNIGLIVSLSTYARVNEFGFIETPYRIVKEGRVLPEVKFLTAIEEENQVIAPADQPVNHDGSFKGDLISARKGGDFVNVVPSEVNMVDVSPNQLVSVAATLIPFLEHDDANRALMGSNMQRQAVPLMRPEIPLVGTGMERIVARDSGAVVVAKRSGIVESVDASRIVIKCESAEKTDRDTGVDIYTLIKYQRSNQDTCFNQKAIVNKGQRVRKGDIIADGPATDNGELALGHNVMVAFMSWGGYNYEDSILVSERIVKEDIYTSIHIEEFETMARDTKLGKEDITRDIPNVGEEALRNLDDSGIVRMGVSVKSGDILVGKITPKGETQLSSEEKLLRAIFGEKASDVRDTSLRVPPGVEGTVIDAKVFTRKGAEKDHRSQYIEDEAIAMLQKDREDEIRIITEAVKKEVGTLLQGKQSGAKIVDPKRKKIYLKKGDIITPEILSEIPLHLWKEITVADDEETERAVGQMMANLYDKIEVVEAYFNEKTEKLKASDELPPGVIKMVKVYIAIKRKLQAGDKMAGRHGNKGVLSRILPEEDMPYFKDGRPVDIVLNPLGVPSRMNVGQILETHLGWAAKGLGEKLNDMLDSYQKGNQLRDELKGIYQSREFEKFVDGATEEETYQFVRKLRRGIAVSSPVFDGATESDIRNMLKLANLPSTGQAILYDGRTGEPFDQEITVGMIYMLKLHHLVDNKIHARSIGPYSLVTQQPLGGKAQFGGQRLGEMEVWAMEAYGAAYSLQEFLTVKSDDVAGRTRIYEAIVKGENTSEPGLPESFNVLVKELQSLCLDVELIEEE
ncbi:DNA-directed RNA polymerase subunit beta [Syntrophus aciditrophicus]|uniref:DNA-directed RNA polymerase subunit beta n=1 Tax=Syntrophus aciditrophicus (strain SB) TaxID=56780 RepID=RPOB_SYNAS|nr:DNA-directed RNA polymerase subunit beta [Syntrophus aciditrophicus]Q2LQ87.1 RecName: Full=DNA-directed RNA polymerase subunit beta; Short=RNAP subunit beta; AltName: Full=RNA polymerase subunit beta; AltName: Full=Transcriptase subunit beta [Syntrophus aciditrophicus SB]ABC76172.1 DNA-directed RNA polymerase beta chain [Syntrophus aciditrophicus SB]OPY17601.1 MAG: DNA-directed RNA polymerase subunit beta [Syntrophus sp. PtaB.Bin075]